MSRQKCCAIKNELKCGNGIKGSIIGDSEINIQSQSFMGGSYFWRRPNFFIRFKNTFIESPDNKEYESLSNLMFYKCCPGIFLPGEKPWYRRERTEQEIERCKNKFGLQHYYGINDFYAEQYYQYINTKLPNGKPDFIGMFKRTLNVFSTISNINFYYDNELTDPDINISGVIDIDMMAYNTNASAYTDFTGVGNGAPGLQGKTVDDNGNRVNFQEDKHTLRFGIRFFNNDLFKVKPSGEDVEYALNLQNHNLTQDFVIETQNGVKYRITCLLDYVTDKIQLIIMELKYYTQQELLGVMQKPPVFKYYPRLVGTPSYGINEVIDNKLGIEIDKERGDDKYYFKLICTPSDNFVYFNKISMVNFKFSTILHEFCHVLGMYHTHQLDVPQNNINFNVKKLKNNGFTMGDIQINFTNKVTIPDAAFDVDSIMCYNLDDYILNGTRTKVNYFLSTGDIAYIQSKYGIRNRMENYENCLYEIYTCTYLKYFLFLLIILLLIFYSYII